ncbi:hypothetical protein EJ04DRAFT_109160 [Polyplosphaeria fusca]|uniref:Uncharacterized protein n=1 Tax=Polyplosphaeria fusca TaxID=682080 RepID=A0A9P4UXI9_9PLEO|nr:hypothetical protein EJ04DRAFT_109160 [Polyplosphaeria fusca]
MLTTTRPLYTRYKKHKQLKLPSDTSPDSDPETYHDVPSPTHLRVPEECPPQPFPSPAAALQQFCAEYNRPLLLPPPVQTPPLGYRETIIEVGENEEVEMLDTSGAILPRSEAAFTKIPTEAWARDMAKGNAAVHVHVGAPSPRRLANLESESQCPTPRPRSVIGIVAASPTALDPSSPNDASMRTVSERLWKADSAREKRRSGVGNARTRTEDARAMRATGAAKARQDSVTDPGKGDEKVREELAAVKKRYEDWSRETSARFEEARMAREEGE